MNHDRSTTRSQLHINQPSLEDKSLVMPARPKLKRKTDCKQKERAVLQVITVPQTKASWLKLLRTVTAAHAAPMSCLDAAECGATQSRTQQIPLIGPTLTLGKSYGCSAAGDPAPTG